MGCSVVNLFILCNNFFWSVLDECIFREMFLFILLWVKFIILLIRCFILFILLFMCFSIFWVVLLESVLERKFMFIFNDDKGVWILWFRIVMYCFCNFVVDCLLNKVDLVELSWLFILSWWEMSLVNDVIWLLIFVVFNVVGVGFNLYKVLKNELLVLYIG